MLSAGRGAWTGVVVVDGSSRSWNRRRAAGFVATVGLATIALAAPVAVATTERPETNGLLVFQREVVAADHTQDDVWTVEPDGSGPVRLTQTPQFNEFGPVWSRAGDQIAFWRTPAPFG